MLGLDKFKMAIQSQSTSFHRWWVAFTQNKDQTAENMAKSMIKHGFVQNKDKQAIINMIKASNVNYRQSKFLVQEMFDNLPLNDKKKMDQLVEDMYRYAGSIIKGVSGPYIKLM